MCIRDRVYTTPWDNYLVATNVWWYDPALVKMCIRDRCRAITREHSRTFFIASALMHAEHRRAIQALYAFCRVSDDIVDRNDGDRAADLRAWRQRSLGSNPGDDPVALAWADTCVRYHIPRQYAEQLLDGVAGDLNPRRYETLSLIHICPRALRRGI